MQNADDARARQVKFVFDRRKHSNSTLFSPELSAFQGPALLAYNSSHFEEVDFESLRRLGASKKWNDLGKTGRFGIGFNSVLHLLKFRNFHSQVYHITDLPSFVSSNYLVILDPHAQNLPGDSQCYGKRSFPFLR